MSSTKKQPNELPLGVIALSKDQKQAYLLLRYLKNNSILVQSYHWGIELDEELTLIRQLRVLDYGFFFSHATFLVNFDRKYPTHLQPFHPVIYDNDLIRAILIDIVRPGIEFLDTNYGEVKITSINWKEDKISIRCREKGLRRYTGNVTVLDATISKALTTIPLHFTKKASDLIVGRFTG